MTKMESDLLYRYFFFLFSCCEAEYVLSFTQKNETQENHANESFWALEESKHC